MLVQSQDPEDGRLGERVMFTGDTLASRPPYDYQLPTETLDGDAEERRYHRLGT